MKILKKLYVQVLIGIFIGVIFGAFAPSIAINLKPFADIFIKLIKLIIAPIIFLTMVSGITNMNSIRAVSKIGGIAIVYFFILSIFALSIGIIVANLFKPGAGLNIDSSLLDINDAKTYIGHTQYIESVKDFFMNIVPNSFVEAFTSGNILQVLFIAILFSIGLILYGENARPISQAINNLSHVFFKIVHVIMYYAPIASCAAMGYTIGMYGISTLLGLLSLLLSFYITCLLFLMVFLGFILYFCCKINIFKLLNYIKSEILIVLGTSSSETVLPNIMEKLEELGCDKATVGLVVPTGYSFNLDGTAIYLSLAALFIAQAMNINLTIQQQLIMLLIMVVSSKGAAGVTGSGFIILASTLSTLGTVPVSGIVIILGIDRFMSEGRAITNMIGNTIGTIIISKYQGSLNINKLQKAIGGNSASQ